MPAAVVDRKGGSLGRLGQHRAPDGRHLRHVACRATRGQDAARHPCVMEGAGGGGAVGKRALHGHGAARLLPPNGPLVALARPLALPRRSYSTMLMLSAMPVSFFSLIVSTVFDLDRELSRLLVAVSTVAAIAGVVVWQVAFA